MTKPSMKNLFPVLIAASLWAGAATAQEVPPPKPNPSTSPVGLWQTVDDKTGEVRGEVRIFDSGGIIYGKIARVIDPKAINQRCVKCTDDRHDKPILGLDVIRGVHADGPNSWSGGEILDPETGDTYRVSMRLEDAGHKLVVRGSIMGGLIGRSQTWVRAPG